MGIDDRDDEYRSRGQAARRRGSYDGGEPPTDRSYQRGRPRGYDEQSPSRSSGRRDYAREDDQRSGSSPRYERGGPGAGYDRRPRPDQSGAGRRSRADWDDDAAMRRDRRGPSDQYSRGGGNGRSPRPPTRDDWEAAARSRGGARSPSPGDSGARNRRAGAPGRGGLWGDDPTYANGSRRNMMNARDPRAARRGLAQIEEEEESSGASAFGKALVAIVLALVIGAGAAYGYYIYSTPKIPANVTQPNAAPTSGASGLSVDGHALSARFVQPAIAYDAAQQTLVVGATASNRA